MDCWQYNINGLLTVSVWPFDTPIDIISMAYESIIIPNLVCLLPPIHSVLQLPQTLYNSLYLTGSIYKYIYIYIGILLIALPAVQLAQCQLLLVKLLFVQYTVLLTLRDKRFVFWRLCASREICQRWAELLQTVLYVKSLNVVSGLLWELL